jgi:hypothetical protein
MRRNRHSTASGIVQRRFVVVSLAGRYLPDYRESIQRRRQERKVQFVKLRHDRATLTPKPRQMTPWQVPISSYKASGPQPAGLTLREPLAPHPDLPRRTAQRWIRPADARGKAARGGQGRARRYRAAAETLFSSAIATGPLPQPHSTARSQCRRRCSGTLDPLLAKAREAEDSFEQSFFAMVHIPYLQPCVDAHKRVSRLAANLPLIRDNLCPLTSMCRSAPAAVRSNR